MSPAKQLQTTTETKRKQNYRRRRRGMCLEDRPILESNAAGLDIGAREIFAAVPADRDAQPVRVFLTFTADLNAMAKWLLGCGIRSVAMESTGVYWIAPYEVLEQHGLKVCLVNARHMKNVPGKRTDWQECQWLQYLHAVGLLRPAFRPEDQVCALRAVQRHRAELVAMSAQHVQHMHKALTQMNIQLHHVINDLTGKTGLDIVAAILAGERDPQRLAQLRDARIRADQATICKSLVGNWRSEHLFTLQQSYQMYQLYRERIHECDLEIEGRMQGFSARVDPAQKPLPPDGKQHRRQRKTKKAGDWSGKCDLRTETYKLFGVDVMQIPGLENQALRLYGETGRDMSRWPSFAHFTSWCGLCPDNDVSGGRVLWRAVRPIQNHTGHLFRVAAHSLHHNRSPLGDFLRRMRARFGPRKAITITARKIAVIFYTMVKHQVEYDETLWALRDQQNRKHQEKLLQRKAARMGFQLLPLPMTS